MTWVGWTLFVLWILRLGVGFILSTHREKRIADEARRVHARIDAVRSLIVSHIAETERHLMPVPLLQNPEPAPAPVVPITSRLRLVRARLDKAKPPKSDRDVDE